MRALVLAMSIAALALPACQADDDLCLVASTMSDACGMPLSKAQCKRLSARDTEALVESLQVMRCSEDASTREPDAQTCRLAGWPCPPALGPEPQKKAPAHTMVFVGGIDAHDAFDWNAEILAAVAENTGARVVRATLPSWASTSDRVAALFATLLARGATDAEDGPKMNLVCYAVGGIDCRALVSPDGPLAADPDALRTAQRSVASITTIATPHRGTRVADAAVIALETGTDADLVETVTGLSLEQSIASGALLDTLRELTLAAAAKKSAAMRDAEGIHYQSFAAVSHAFEDMDSPSADEITEACGAPLDATDHMQPALWVTAPFGSATNDENGIARTTPTDGMVSVESARWGEFRGCIPADHYHVIGQHRRAGRDPWTGFDARRFYSWLANDLAERGF